MKTYLLPAFILSGLTISILSFISFNDKFLVGVVTDPRLNKNVTQENLKRTVCVSGYTKTIRPPVSYTNKLKLQQIESLSLQDKNPTHYEEDHLISLELGGNPTETTNLWPQPYSGSPNAYDKDALENLLHRQLCNGSITLKEAQNKIIHWWLYVGKGQWIGFGGVDLDEDDN